MSYICVFVVETVQHPFRDPNRPRPTAALGAESSVGPHPAHQAPFPKLPANLCDLRKRHVPSVSERTWGLGAQQHMWLSLQPSYRVDESREQPDLRSSRTGSACSTWQ